MLEKLKNSWKSRTVWLSGLMMILSAIQVNLINIAPLVDDKTYSIIALVVSFLLIILRFDTDKSLDKK